MKPLFKNIFSEPYKLRKYVVLKYYLSDYRRDPKNFLHTLSVHRKGFLLADWEASGMNKDNYKKYLSLRDYYKMHPFNGRYSYLVDDKLVIKYILSGTSVSSNMPAYYYLIDNGGLIHRFLDLKEGSEVAAGTASSTEAVGAESVIALLKEKGCLALKPVKGALGSGFLRVEFRDGKIYVNHAGMSRSGFQDLLKKSRNYIVTECLRPHPVLAEYWPQTVNTIRYLVGRVGGEWRMLKSYVRFGTSKTGEIENFDRGGILCYIDEDGSFDGGYVLTGDPGRFSTLQVTHHPDTQKALTGNIPDWTDLQNLALKIEELLPQTEYLGFDFAVTDQDEVKLLEINSMNSLDALQLDGSILETPNGKWFFGARM